MRMVLVGPHAGKDITLGGFHFKGGVCDVPHNAEAAVRILGGYYSAHPEGSDALAKAEAAWNEKHPAPNPAASAPPAGATDTNPSPPPQTGPGVSGEINSASAKGKKK